MALLLNLVKYKVTSFLKTKSELSTETCSKNVYSLGPCLFQTNNVNNKAICCHASTIEGDMIRGPRNDTR